MKRKNQLTLRLVVNNDDGAKQSGGGYKSGRSSCLDTPVKASTANTRSAGTRPSLIQREMLPCDLYPKPRAKADWPPTASHAFKMTSLDISLFNAQIVNSVNASRANPLAQTRRMSRKAEAEPCEFWKRLVAAWELKGLPTSQNGVAEWFGMKGNGSTGRWYRGDGKPETEKLIRMAQAGGVTVDWLLTGNEPRTPIRPGTDLDQLLRLWANLSPESREHVMRTAHGQFAMQQQESAVSEVRRPRVMGTK